MNSVSSGHARLFWNVFSIESRRLMSYRADFFITAGLNFVAAITVPYFLWGAMFASTEKPTLGGYSYHGMVIYACLAALIGRVVRGGDNITDVAEDIYEGSLNKYLLYPTHYLPFKYAQHLGNLFPSLIQLFAFCPILALVVDIPEEIGITPASMLMAALSIMVASALYYLLAFQLQLVAFWADNVWSLNVMLRMASRLLGGALLPLTLFPDWCQGILHALPFSALYHLPVSALLGQVSAGEWARGMGISLAWCVFAILAGRVLWMRGTRVYTGVGI